MKKELLTQIYSDRKVRRYAATKSHKLFFHLYFPHYINYAIAPFQEEMFQLTEDEKEPMLLFMAFRKSGKTSIIGTSYPIWSIVGKPQKKFVVLLSRTQNQAKIMLTNIKQELESNNILVNDFGPFQQGNSEWTNYGLELPKYQARIMAASCDQSIRGIRFKEHRPDLIILDDIDDIASTNSWESREKMYDWYLREVIPLGGTNTRIIILGNMIHSDSLMMRLIKEIDEGKRTGTYRKYPLIDENNIPLWPAVFPSQKEIDTLKNSIGNNRAWNNEYLLRPHISSEYAIDPNWIIYYDGIKESKGAFLYNVISIDPAISEKENACFTGIVLAEVYRVNGKLKIYVLPNSFTIKESFPVIVETIKNLNNSMSQKGRTRILIEATGAQDYICQQLRHIGINNIEGIRPIGDKLTRLETLSHAIKNGTILFHRTKNTNIITQIVNFKNVQYKDLADSFSQMGQAVINDSMQTIPDIFFL